MTTSMSLKWRLFTSKRVLPVSSHIANTQPKQRLWRPPIKKIPPEDTQSIYTIIRIDRLRLRTKGSLKKNKWPWINISIQNMFSTLSKKTMDRTHIRTMCSTLFPLKQIRLQKCKSQLKLQAPLTSKIRFSVQTVKAKDKEFSSPTCLRTSRSRFSNRTLSGQNGVNKSNLHLVDLKWSLRIMQINQLLMETVFNLWLLLWCIFLFNQVTPRWQNEDNDKAEDHHNIETDISLLQEDKDEKLLQSDSWGDPSVQFQWETPESGENQNYWRPFEQ